MRFSDEMAYALPRPKRRELLVVSFSITDLAMLTVGMPDRIPLLNPLHALNLNL